MDEPGWDGEMAVTGLPIGDPQAMTDAKGLSEVERWYVDEWHNCREANDGPFVKYADYTALAERLKFMEAERDRLQRENFEMVMTKIPNLQILLGKRVEENDQLTAKLANLNAMHQQLTAVLHDDDMPTVVPIANVVEDVMRLRADLERARAEVETLKRVHKHCCKPCGAPDCDPYKTLAQSNARLKTALMALKHNDGCYCEAAFSGPGCHPRHSPECQEAQAALKETP